MKDLTARWGLFLSINNPNVRRMSKFLILSVIASILLWTGCSLGPASPEENGQPAIVITDVVGNQMVFPGEGGPAALQYIIENPAEGGSVKATVDKEWVADVSYGDPGVVAFNVLASDEEESRNAILTLVYEWADGSIEAQINIVQTGRTVFFDIEVPEDEVTCATARVITRCLGDQRWFDGLMQSSLVTGGQDLAEMVQEDFKALVDRYTELGYSVGDILYASDYVDDYVWTGLSSNTSYTPYAFGMDLECNLTTDIFLGPEFTTSEIVMTDLTFVLEVEPKQTSALLDIAPSDQSAVYFATVIGDSFYEAGYSDEEIMAYLCNTYGADLETYAQSGTVNGLEVKGMTPGTHYTAVAFGIDLDSYMYNSAMASVEFSTAGAGETGAYATGNMDHYWLVSDLLEYNPEYGDVFTAGEDNPLLSAVVLDLNDESVGAYYSSWIGDVSGMGDFLFDATVNGNFYAEEDGCVNMFYTNFEAASTLTVVAVDADGNFGDMYVTVARRSEDGVSKDFALFDEYYARMNASSLSGAHGLRAPERPVLCLTASPAPAGRGVSGERMPVR